MTTKEDIINFFKRINEEKLKTLSEKYKILFNSESKFIVTRWGTFECSDCKISFESESLFNEHEKSELHILNSKSNSKEEFAILDVIKNYEKYEPIVFLSIYEHNSNVLPWRNSNAKIIYVDQSENGLNYLDLINKLKGYRNNVIKIGSFTAASNLSGEKLNVDLLSIILHSENALAFFDYATAAPYCKIDMNYISDEYKCDIDGFKLDQLDENMKKLCYKDGIFFSPHKFIGGPNTSGVLIIKQNIVKYYDKPSETGGGIVLFVTKNSEK